MTDLQEAFNLASDIILHSQKCCFNQVGGSSERQASRTRKYTLEGQGCMLEQQHGGMGPKLPQGGPQGNWLFAGGSVLWGLGVKGLNRATQAAHALAYCLRGGLRN